MNKSILSPCGMLEENKSEIIPMQFTECRLKRRRISLESNTEMYVLLWWYLIGDGDYSRKPDLS